jgi:hypothetical protein
VDVRGTKEDTRRQLKFEILRDESYLSNPRIPYMLSSERRRLAPPRGRPLIVHIRSIRT